ncbi:MAG: flagellar assembly protein FliW [Helicobacteraceae bacterium]
MKFDMKLPILGFEHINEYELEEIDEAVAKITAVDNPTIAFTLINPYSLREYSFDIPTSARIMLDIKEDSQLLVYNILAMTKPYEKSVVNFLAPIIFNKSNGTAGQVILSEAGNPDFGYAQEISSFLAA